MTEIGNTIDANLLNGRLRSLYQQAIDAKIIMSTSSELPKTIPTHLYDTEVPGLNQYHTIVTIDMPDGTVNTVPVMVESIGPLNFYDIQQSAIEALERDAALQAKYGIQSGYTIRLDGFYILRAF